MEPDRKLASNVSNVDIEKKKENTYIKQLKYVKKMKDVTKFRQRVNTCPSSSSWGSVNRGG